MKSFKAKIAIVSCTLALAACGAGETETDKASIDEVGGSAYQQALGADGNVDCDRIHEVLWDHGIDPALLEPDAVFEACINSGTGEDTCQVVAYTCFGDQGCSEPHPPEPEPICEELYQLVEGSNIDPTSYDPEFVFQYCLDAGYPDDICSQAWDCFPNEPQPPQPPPVCEEARDLAQQLGIDPDNASPEELLNACLDHGYDEDICWTIIEQCVDPNDPADPTDPGDPNEPPSDVDCEELAQLLSDQGYEVPLNDQDAAALYEECVNNNQDEELCQMALACVQ